ncbi:MAG: efflux RND transporter permease subunit [Bacteroidota bacterium]
MKNIIQSLIQKPRIVDIIVGLIVVVGIAVVASMRSNFLPPEPINFVVVNVTYPGASPQEMEEEVVDKIEDNLDGLKGIDRITSSAQESFASIRVELLEVANPNEVLQDISNAVDKITTFPMGIETPVVFKEEILNYTMTLGLVGGTSLSVLKDHAKHLKEELTYSPNLSQVFLSGYPEEEIEVRLRESDLRAYQLTFDEVARAIQASNIKASGGKIKTDEQNILIRLDNRTYYAKGLMNTVVKASPDGKLVRLSDVAEVKNQFADKPNSTFVNGEAAVILKVFSRSEEDILANAAFVNEEVAKFNRQHEGVEVVVIEDKAISLSDAIGTLQNNAWQGILLVLIILGLFLNPRIAFWVAFKIPVALLGMFILSTFYDLTINQVSLFGLIVVLGVIVDDGVVVAENIYQRFQEGKNPLQAAVQGTMEVFPAILSSLATTAVAFSLFFFFDGQLGDYFSDISFVVCATLFVALLESMLILPVHIARSKALNRDKKEWKLTKWTNNSLLVFRDKIYSAIIRFSLRIPILSILAVLGIMILTVSAVGSGTIKSTFFPTIDQDVITAKLELPLGTNESITSAKLAIMEEKVWEVNEQYTSQRSDGQALIKYVERVIGPSNNQGYLNIYMLEGDKRGILSFKIADSIREAVGPIPEARNLSYGSIAVFGKPVSIALVGRNLEELRAAKNKVRQFLEERADLKDVTDTDQLGVPEVEMQLTPKAKFLGLSEAIVFDQIRKGFFGLEAQSVQRGDEEVKVWLRYAETDRKSIEDVKKMRLQLPNGSSYPIEELATFKSKENVAVINHQNGIREIKVEADVANLLVSVPAVLGEAEAAVLKEVQREFPNIKYTLEGEARLSAKTQNSSQTPSMMVFIAIIGILMLNYRSIGKTLAILAMLPFAFVGVAWGSYLHNIPVSIFSVLGMIALWGILINNGLVLVSTYNEKIKEGLSVGEALRTAAISRFRPIVLTTITTVFGLAPLLLNNSISAQFLKPTAIAIAYGLIFGMILTLVFLPSVMLSIANLKYYFNRYVRRIKDISAADLDVVIREKQKELAG